MFTVSEHHFSVADLAEAWNLSQDTIRRLFADEPGVLNLAKPSKRKRIYRSIRIPQHVAERVYRRITNAGQN
jgi:transcriptional regulator GlxA family with amidase domain